MNDDGSVLDGCTCHPSCGSCGFHVALYDAFSPCETCDWPATEFDCLTCRDGLVKINLFDDGTGSCVAPQSAWRPSLPSLSPSLPCPTLTVRCSDGVEETKELKNAFMGVYSQERNRDVSFGKPSPVRAALPFNAQILPASLRGVAC